MATHSLGARTIQIAWPQSTQTIHTIRYSPQGVRAFLQGLDHRKHSQTPVEMRLEQKRGRWEVSPLWTSVKGDDQQQRWLEVLRLYRLSILPIHEKHLWRHITSLWKENNEVPQCGAPLKELTNKKDGSVFFGCTRYPKCRFTRNK